MNYAALRAAILEGPKAPACVPYVRTFEEEAEYVLNEVRSVTLPDNREYFGPVTRAERADGAEMWVPAPKWRVQLRAGVERIPGKEIAKRDQAIADILNQPDGTPVAGKIGLPEYMSIIMRAGALTTILAAAANNPAIAVAVAAVQKAAELRVDSLDFGIDAIREQHEALVAAGALQQQVYDQILAAASHSPSAAELAVGGPVSAGDVSIALRYGAAFPPPDPEEV